MSTDSQPRPRLVAWLRSRPRVFATGVVAIVAASVFVLWWFQPQALLFDRVVDEAFPTVAPEPVDGGASDAEAGARQDSEADVGHDGEELSAEESSASAGPLSLSSGEFASRNRYTVTGTATAYALEDGGRTLRLEMFESTNGPDLLVYLTRADHLDDDDAMEADFIDLGDLRGNLGDQNYGIPDGVDLDVYDTVVIWCRRFSVSFGAADLVAADVVGG